MLVSRINVVLTTKKVTRKASHIMAILIAIDANIFLKFSDNYYVE